MIEIKRKCAFLFGFKMTKRNEIEEALILEKFEFIDRIYGELSEKIMENDYKIRFSLFFDSLTKWSIKTCLDKKIKYSKFKTYKSRNIMQYRSLKSNDHDISRPKHNYFTHISESFRGKEYWKSFMYIPCGMNDCDQTLKAFLHTYDDCTQKVLLASTCFAYHPKAIEELKKDNRIKDFFQESYYLENLFEILHRMFPQMDNQLKEILDFDPENQLKDLKYNTKEFHSNILDRISKICKFCTKYNCNIHFNVKMDLHDIQTRIKLLDEFKNDDESFVEYFLKNYQQNSHTLCIPKQSKKLTSERRNLIRTKSFYPCIHKKYDSHEKNQISDNCSCFIAGLRCEPVCSCYNPPYYVLSFKNNLNINNKDLNCNKAKISSKHNGNDPNICPLTFIGCQCLTGCKSLKCSCRLRGQECNISKCQCCIHINHCQNMMFQQLDEIKSNSIQINKEWIQSSSEITNSILDHYSRFPKLMLCKTSSSGYGVMTCHDLKRGTFIREYVGERIADLEAERRGLICDQESMSYIFACNDDEAIDAQFYGNISRYINHSDDPNCEVKVIYVNGLHRVAIFAKKNINKGQQLLFDYNYGSDHKKIHFT